MTYASTAGTGLREWEDNAAQSRVERTLSFLSLHDTQARLALAPWVCRRLGLDGRTESWFRLMMKTTGIRSRNGRISPGVSSLLVRSPSIEVTALALPFTVVSQ